jgi:hypothetical protein
MKGQPLPADRTVCLDYLSAFQPMTLFKAAKYGDWAVLCTGVGSLLLKISVRRCTLASAHKLTLEDYHLHRSAVHKTNDCFDLYYCSFHKRLPSQQY